ncbi:recombinase family protein [Amycolatopsis mediterranei]|uniref:recombinase family protein n=1 Tax=Amycolatopsis mediterranei TaxID=33910 RepID=UPI0034460A70
MSEPKSSPTAVFYLRTNRSAAGGKARSVAAQRAACLRRAIELGAIVQGEYIDIMSGNSEPADRPSLSVLLSDLKENPATYVITYDPSRIARRMHHYASIAWTVGKAGSRLEIATLPHREVDNVGAYLIGRIGSIQLMDIAPREQPEESFTEDKKE